MATSMNLAVSETPVDIVSRLALTASTTYVVQNRSFRELFLYEGASVPENPETETGAFVFGPEEFLQVDVDSSSTPVWAWTDYGNGQIAVLED